MSEPWAQTVYPTHTDRTIVKAGPYTLLKHILIRKRIRRKPRIAARNVSTPAE